MGIKAGAASRIFQKSLGSPALGGVADVLAAVTDDGTEQTITTGFTQPPTPRTVSASSAGTAGDIKAIQVTVNGLDENGGVISEVLPIFTVNTATTVQGAKVFASITSFVIPAHDGNGATTSLGLGDILGLGFVHPRDTVLRTFFNGVKEGTDAAVTFNSTDVESNTIDLNSALDGSEVLVDYYKPA